jgi:hypothetical protein
VIGGGGQQFTGRSSVEFLKLRCVRGGGPKKRVSYFGKGSRKKSVKNK